jgi:hypothetical protein
VLNAVTEGDEDYGFLEANEPGKLLRDP